VKFIQSPKDLYNCCKLVIAWGVIPKNLIDTKDKRQTFIEEHSEIIKKALFEKRAVTFPPKKRSIMSSCPPFPGLTHKTLRKYPPNSKATTTGHLDNIRKNTRSTKKAPKKAPLPVADPFDFPPQPQDNSCTHTCFLATTVTKNCVFTDQTGRLPQASSSGNNYILIAYDYDSNCILLCPLHNRKAETLTTAIASIALCCNCSGKIMRISNRLLRLLFSIDLLRVLNRES
jgi:hypothetical protein